MTRPSQSTSLRLDAPAKLNLCLELLGKLEDGFHQLRTLMVTIGWRDTLRVQSGGGPAGEAALSLRLWGDPRLTRGVPADGSNLVLRGLELLRQEAGAPLGARVDLVKRIPSQAGLGGGSSDAAAALVAANRVWELGFSIERLRKIAAKLGSDIPFFVSAIGAKSARAAVATGRGERVAPVPTVAGLPVVIVKPPQGLSTAEVYGECLPEDYAPPSGTDRTSAAAAALGRGDWRGLAQNMTNGLQPAGARRGPWLEGLRGCFNRCGCEAHQLSGSGSAYFGLFRTMGEARRVAARLRALRVGQSFATTIG